MKKENIYLIGLCVLSVVVSLAFHLTIFQAIVVGSAIGFFGRVIWRIWMGE